jgi:SAM-dependent methyltransferase
VSFVSGAEPYDRFMGRYSVPLAPVFADFAGLAGSEIVLDVGCGPGALAGELVRRMGSGSVCAVDPSEAFVAAVRERLPGVAVERAVSESLPFAAGSFDAALAQLVVHFMSDPVAGLREMRRVVKPSGVVAVCVWDHAGGQGPLGVFWEAARALDAEVEDESSLAGTRAGHLAELLKTAGLRDIIDGAVSVEVEHSNFEEWWEPFTLGVGPAGTYVSQLTTNQRNRLRDSCKHRLPDGPFVIVARAWAARGLA